MTNHSPSSAMPSGISSKLQRLNHWMVILVALSFSASIMLHLYTITFSRMLADDFCSAWRAQVQGPLRAAYAWYRIWSGRYSANFLDGLVGWLGASFYQVSIILLVLLWIAALYFCFHQLLKRVLERRARSTSLILALAVSSATFNSIPLVQQSIYWGQGMRALLPPLILLPLFLGLLLKVRLDNLSVQRFWSFAGFTFLYAVFSGGFSETGLVTQFGYAGIGLAVALWKKKRRLAVIAGVFLLGSLAALALMWFSPGRAVRQEAWQPVFDLLKILSISAASYWDWLMMQFTRNAWFTAMLLALGGWFAIQTSHQRISFCTIPLLIAVGSSLAVIIACFIPSAYILSETIPDRTQIIPQSLWTGLLLTLGFLLGNTLSNWLIGKWQSIILVGLLAILVAGATYHSITNTVTISQEYQTYAVAWDQRDTFLRSQRAAGVTSVMIPRLTNPAYLDNLVNNPEYWVNRCYSDYYGLELLVPEQ